MPTSNPSILIPDDAPEPVIVERRSTPSVTIQQAGSMGLAGWPATISNMTATAVMFVFLFLQRSDAQHMNESMLRRIDQQQEALSNALAANERDRQSLGTKIDGLVSEIRASRIAVERAERTITTAQPKGQP